MPNDILRVSDAQVAADRSILAAIVSGFVDGRKATVERVGDDVTVTSHDDVPIVWFGAAHEWRNAVRYAEEPETPSQRSRREAREAQRDARRATVFLLDRFAVKLGFIQTDPLSDRRGPNRPRLEMHEVFDAGGDVTGDRWMLDLSRDGKRLRLYVPTQEAGEDVLTRFVEGVDFALLASAYDGTVFL